VNEGTQGPPIADVVSAHLRSTRSVRIEENRHVKVTGADPRGVMG
jgi:sulfur-oxidizing protein SoxB